jgi:hypothetical protein
MVDKPHVPFDSIAADGIVAGRTVYYATLYPKLREVAYAHGYALALHGSLSRDLDVVAVPWVEGAATGEGLVAALVEAAGGLVTPGRNPTIMPHGRRAWTVHLVGNGGYVDLSIMPLGGF